MHKNTPFFLLQQPINQKPYPHKNQTPKATTTTHKAAQNLPLQNKQTTTTTQHPYSDLH